MNNASSYDERSAIRKALRKAKGDAGKVKKTGSATYRRAGFQAPTKVTIPNSVTGNVLPDRVSTDNLGKLETPQTKATISYLKSKETDKKARSAARGSSTTPTRSRGSSQTSTGNTPEPKVGMEREREGEGCTSNVRHPVAEWKELSSSRDLRREGGGGGGGERGGSKVLEGCSISEVDITS